MNQKINSSSAPEPVGSYPHARKVGNLLFLSGVGPRKPGTKVIPGVMIDGQGNPLGHDIEIQCHSVFKNVKIILAGMIAPSSYGKKYKDSFDIIYPDLAKKFNLLFIPFLLQDVALNPELNLSDGIHPNEKGVKIISNTISKKLITILKN